MDVYFEETVEVLVEDPLTFSEKAALKILEAKEIEFTGIKRQNAH